MKTPDPNANAPRPKHTSSDDPSGPTMDRPPPAPSRGKTGFDQATLAEEREARTGTLPGTDDLAPAKPGQHSGIERVPTEKTGKDKNK